MNKRIISFTTTIVLTLFALVLAFGFFFEFKSVFHGKKQVVSSLLKEDSVLKKLGFYRVKPGNFVEDMKLLDLEENVNTSLVDLSKGKDYTLTIFMQSWCPYCKKEMEGLDVFLAKNGLGYFNVVLISDEKDKVDELKKISYNLKNLKVYLADFNFMAQKYGLTAVPSKLFIRENMEILGVSSGAGDWSEDGIKEEFEKLKSET